MLSPYLTKFEKSRVPHPVATYHLTQGRGGQRGKGRGRLAPEFRRNSQRNSRSRPLLLARLSRNGALGLAIRRVVIQATFRVKGYLTLPLTLSLSSRFANAFKLVLFFFFLLFDLPSFDSPEETRVKRGSSNYRRGSSPPTANYRKLCLI